MEGRGGGGGGEYWLNKCGAIWIGHTCRLYTGFNLGDHIETININW